MYPTSVLALVLVLPGCLIDADTYERLAATFEDGDGDGVTPRGGDCDDDDPAVHPGLPDGCDGIDQDCDAIVDEDSDLAWAPDADGDGYGSAATAVRACQPPEGWIADARDCDDADPAASPAGVESCNGHDDDCDGEADDGLALTTWYRDADGDGFGDTNDTVLACGAFGGYASQANDCDDTDATVSPAAAEVCGDGVDGDCDGTANSCGWDGARSLADTTWIGGAAAAEGAGADLAVGDVDGDGDDDVFVATSTANAAYVVYGEAERPYGASLATLAVAEIRPASFGPDFRFGRAVALCDFDGEGGPDLVASGQEAGGLSLVFVFDDASVGRVDESEARYAVAGLDDGLGSALACGTLDEGDAPDLVIGAPALAVDGVSGTGGLHVVPGPYAGTSSGWSGSGDLPRAVVYGESPSQALGSAIATGDIDGDGIGDVLAGAPDDGDAGVGAGAAWVLYGPVADGAAPRDLGVKLTGARARGQAGAVAAGDLDGDGHADVVVGAPADESAGSDTGAVYVVFGDALARTGVATLNAADATLAGGLAGMRFGERVAVIGGRFGEGAALAVGAPTAGGAGAVYAWDGADLGGTLVATEAHATWLGEAPGDGAGTGLAGTGDLDGDGWVDLLVGAPGQDDAATGSGAIYVAWGSGL